MIERQTRELFFRRVQRAAAKDATRWLLADMLMTGAPGDEPKPDGWSSRPAKAEVRAALEAAKQMERNSFSQIAEAVLADGALLASLCSGHSAKTKAARCREVATGWRLDFREDALAANPPPFNVEVPRRFRRAEPDAASPPTSPAASPISAVARYAGASVVTVSTATAAGSGFAVGDGSLIVTSHHVVKDRRDIVVKTHEGRKLMAEWVRGSVSRDLALLAIRDDRLPPLRLAAPGSTQVGQVVVAVGSPGGANGALEQTVTSGIVSALRMMESSYAPGVEIECIQTDAAISPGSSGGPLLGTDRRVVGVVALKVVGRAVEGLNFAVSSREVAETFGDLLEE